MMRLVGFVVLIGIVALLLHLVSLRHSEPEPKPVQELDVQVTPTPEVVSKEDSAAQPEPSAPAASEPPPPAAPPTEEKPQPAQPEPSAPLASEAPPAAPPTEEKPQPAQPEPPAPLASEAPPAAPPTEEKPQPAQPKPPAPPASEPPPPAAPPTEEKPQPAQPEPPAPPAPKPPAAPSAPERTALAETRIEERMLPDEEFFAIEQAQGRTDERTDAQRRRQDQDGWYGWGVLNDYTDPDRAARLLGGAAVVQTGGNFFTLREQTGGRVVVRPIANVSAAYGAIALQAHGNAFGQRLRRALAAGQLLGREADYKLWYLFPRREAAHLGNKVVKVFECHLRESGLGGEGSDRFREQSKLRGAVLALRRANGGRLGIYLPRYFHTGEGRVPVAPACRALDEESRRFASSGAGPAPPEPGAD